MVAIGEQQDQAQVAVPTNPALVPAKAQSWTGGIVYSPHFVPGLTVSVDYFWTLQREVIIPLPSALILTSVDNFGTAI